MNVFFGGGYKLFVEFAPSGKLTFHCNSLFSVVKQKHASEMTVDIFVFRKLIINLFKAYQFPSKGKKFESLKNSSLL